MTKVSEKVIKKIKEEKITPLPKWRFLLKNYFIWGNFLVSIFLGSASFAVMLFFAENNDWDLYKYIQKSFWGFFFISLPYLWIFFLIFSIWLAYYNYKHTKQGYRYTAFLITFLSIIISLFLGIILFSLHWGEKIDKILSQNIEHYDKIMPHRYLIWDNPEKGLLIGKIVNIGKNSLTIKDPENKIWTVDTRQAFIRGRYPLEENLEIKIIGQKTGENTFVAQEIRTGRGNFGSCPLMKENNSSCVLFNRKRK